MSATSATITRLINETAPKIAVVFMGSEPRLLGTLDTLPDIATVKTTVDAMLLAQRLSATYVSRATCSAQSFVLAHG